ncbi:MAG: hypothetical protein JXX14_12335 [Deltaproteobacteria bacterium]|nr:hypothetical protein [Deltaproteobacteria bacterium]
MKNVFRDLNIIGIESPAEDLDIDVRYLTRAKKDEINNFSEEKMAFKVYIKRNIAGLPVRNSRAILGYCMDGSLQKLHMRWPTIDEQTFEFPSVDENNLEDLYSEIMNTLSKDPELNNGYADADAFIGIKV